MKKDLSLYTGPYLDRIFGTRGLLDMIPDAGKFWKDWNYDMKVFSDLQPKTNFPKINVIETDDGYEVEIALAGFDKEDLSLEIKDNCFCIKATKKEENSEESKKYLMKEISSKSFRRALSFPKKILTDNIGCTYKDGIVSCVFKKEVEKAPEDSTIKINIK